jgi:hypothetical protein
MSSAPSYTRHASLEVEAFGSFVNRSIRGSLGSPRKSRSSACFQARACAVLDLPSARLLLRLRAHPSLMRRLFRVPSPLLPARDLSVRASPAWVSPLFATSRTRSHHSRGFPHPALFHPRLSQPLDGLLRTSARGLISSRCHVQGSFCPGASLPAQPPFLVGRSLPPCRCCTVAHSPALAFASTDRLPRAVPLGFEASIRARPRSASPVIHLARSRSPLQFILLQVPLFSRRRLRLPSAFRP